MPGYRREPRNGEVRERRHYDNGWHVCYWTNGHVVWWYGSDNNPIIIERAPGDYRWYVTDESGSALAGTVGDVREGPFRTLKLAQVAYLLSHHQQGT